MTVAVEDPMEAMQEGGAGSASRRIVGLALIATAAVLTWSLADYLVAAGRSIAFPYGLDYGEGIVWEQMRLMLAGKGYARIEGFPAIVFHYPPLYHLACAALAAATGLDQLAAGRLVSVVSTGVMVGFIAAAVAYLSEERHGKAAGWLAGLIAMLIALSTYPVQSWSTLMRVDMLAFALTFAGFYFGLRALTQPKTIHLAAVLFVAAIYTKQTAIPAPAAVFAIHLLVQPRIALAGIATCLGLGLAALGAIMLLTDGGFLHHILAYNINRFDWSHLLSSYRIVLVHSAYVVAAVLGVMAWRRSLAESKFSKDGWKAVQKRMLSTPTAAGHVMVLAFLVLATLMLVTTAKSGSSINYYVEWSCIVALLAGLAFPEAIAFSLGKPGTPRPQTLTVIAILGAAIQAFFLLDVSGERIGFAEPKRSEFHQLVARVEAAPRPIISDEMVVLLRGNKTVVIEPSIYAELTGTGVWDERPLLAKIARREFSFFITASSRLYDGRYSPAVSKAIHSAYPTERRLAGYTLHFPDETLAGGKAQ